MKLRIATLLMFLATPVFADSVVDAVPTSGIEFEYAPGLVVQDETVTISKLGKNFLDQHYSIDVDFHLKNNSDHDITRIVAFILPPVRSDFENYTTWSGVDDNDATALKDFKVTVDGKKQDYTTRTVAVLHGEKISEQLSDLNLPLNPGKIKLMPDGKFDPKYYSVLKKNKLLTKYNLPAWQANIYFEWRQVFPAGKVVNIHQHYTPVVGYGAPESMTSNDLARLFAISEKNALPKSLWNRSPETLATTNPTVVNKNDIAKLSDEKQFYLVPAWILFNLKNSENWKGQIGTFTLIIDDAANAPFAVNDFYSANQAVQTNINGNAMSFTIKDFSPTKNLQIVFLSLPQTDVDLQQFGL